ncbi:hypothetical protein K439DRAFT_1658304, partial [Ramaria rubella]
MPSEETSFLYIICLQKYTLLAALVLMIYDHTLCFGDEVDLIWKVRYNVVAISFLVARYLTPILLLMATLTYYPVWTVKILHRDHSQSCHVFNLLRLAPLAIVLANFFSHSVMILRIYALYGAKRFILILLLFVLTMETFLMISNITFLEKYTEPPPSPLCPYTSDIPKASFIFWTVPLIGDT